jgi:excisionase family DNA binding protein
MSTFDLDREPDAEPLLIPAAEFARLLQISKRTLWRQLSAGQIPRPVRFGGTVRWRLEEIREWISMGCPFPKARENDGRRK